MNCYGLDLNQGTLGLEATTHPTEHTIANFTIVEEFYSIDSRTPQIFVFISKKDSKDIICLQIFKKKRDATTYLKENCQPSIFTHFKRI